MLNSNAINIDRIQNIPHYRLDLLPQIKSCESNPMTRQSMAQVAMSTPSAETMDEAEMDNQKIDTNTAIILSNEDCISHNAENSAYSPEMIAIINNGIRQRINEKIHEIIQIKTTTITANNIDRGANEA